MLGSLVQSGSAVGSEIPRENIMSSYNCLNEMLLAIMLDISHSGPHSRMLKLAREELSSVLLPNAFGAPTVCQEFCYSLAK